MKLQRSLVTVASAAALAPTALFAAPAAFAAAPTAPRIPATSTPSAAVAASSSAAPGTSSSAAPTASPSGAPVPSAPSSSWPGYCIPVPPLTDHIWPGALDDHSDLSLNLSGIPGGVAAGSGWHQFRMAATVPVLGVNSDLKISPHVMKWIAVVGGDSKSLAAHAHLQYFNGKTWADVGKWSGDGTVLPATALHINNTSQVATAGVLLRLRIDAGAPTGRGYVLGFGSYANSVQMCTHFTIAVAHLTVSAPVSTTSSPTPAPASSPSAAALANTGAASQLPLIAGTGAAAIAVGGGAVFAVRRRKDVMRSQRH